MRRLIIFFVIAAGLYSPMPAQASTVKTVSFQAEVWVDNWFALYVNGKLVGQDSVPITTERSFNSEKIKFTASYPFTVGLLVKDFTENASGLEYIGKPNQQIGDGGAIAQIRDLSTNAIIAVTDTAWKLLVVSKAPLNPGCVKSQTPLTDCKAQNLATPKSWATQSYKDSSWKSATSYSQEEVGVKEGYFDIRWSPAASLIWSSDLKLDNTVLIRRTVSKPITKSSTKFELQSSAFIDNGNFPTIYTCDGSSTFPPLQWSNAPSATKSFLITFDTLPGPPRPGEIDSTKHAMFVLFNIPASSSGFTNFENVKGSFGQNFQGRNLGYTPPCSQGPGNKTYTFTIYALDSMLSIDPKNATESAIETLIKEKILAQSTLSVTYARS